MTARQTLLAAALLLASPLRAQTPTGGATPPNGATFGQVEERRSTSQAYFVHVLPGEATVVVSVWGTVPRPGTYEVSNGMDMGQVLSLAGGPLGTPVREPDATEVDREVRIRLYRQAGTTRSMIYDATLEETVASPEAYPILADGDVVEVTTNETERRRWTWRDTATIGGLATSALIAISQVFLILR